MNRYDYEKVDVNNNDLVNIIKNIRDNYIDDFAIKLKQTINLFKTEDGFNCSDIFQYNILPKVKALNYNTIIMNIYELLEKIIKQDEDEDGIIIKNLDTWTSLLNKICLLLFNIKTNNSIIYLNEIIEYRSIFYFISKFIKNRNENTYFYLKKLNTDGKYTEVKSRSYTNSTNNNYIINTVFPEIAEKIEDYYLKRNFYQILKNPDAKIKRDKIYSKEICEILNIEYLKLNESIPYDVSHIIAKINEFKEQFKTSLQTIFNSIDKDIDIDNYYKDKLTIKKQQLLSFLDNILEILKKNNKIRIEQLYSYIILATNLNKLYYLSSGINVNIKEIVATSMIINKFCILLQDINYYVIYGKNTTEYKENVIKKKFFEIYWPQIIGCAKKHDKNTIISEIIKLEIHDIENQAAEAPSPAAPSPAAPSPAAPSPAAAAPPAPSPAAPSPAAAPPAPVPAPSPPAAAPSPAAPPAPAVMTKDPKINITEVHHIETLDELNYYKQRFKNVILKFGSVEPPCPPCIFLQNYLETLAESNVNDDTIYLSTDNTTPDVNLYNLAYDTNTHIPPNVTVFNGDNITKKFVSFAINYNQMRQDHHQMIKYLMNLGKAPATGGGNNKYKKTDKQITVIYKKKEYTRVIYICERKKYVKINKTFMLLSKLKKV